MSPPPLEVLQFVRELSAKQTDILIHLCKVEPECGTLESIIDAWFGGRMAIWSTGEGLVLTQINTLAKGRELFVFGIAGRGMIRVAQEIKRDLQVIARTFECDSIGGDVRRPGLKKLYDAFGAEQVSVYYRLEI